MIRYRVTLTKEEREELTAIASKGSHKSQKVLNALILLSTDSGEHPNARSTYEGIHQVKGIGGL